MKLLSREVVAPSTRRFGQGRLGYVSVGGLGKGGNRRLPWVLLLVLALAPRLMAATAGWTNLADSSVGYWTNNPNWNAASYPGSGAGEFAYLTVRPTQFWANNSGK